MNNEVFGLTQLEAMQLRKPVINTSLPSTLPTIARHQKEGLIIEPNKPDALAEAMQSGCICITSNTGALAKVSNECTIQVDPQKSDKIAQQLNLLLHDPDLGSYYVSAGQQRANDFTWAKAASQTCKIYDSL